MTDAPTTTSTADDDRLFTPALVGASIVVVLGTFMTILDTTIVNVAIDSLSRQFSSPLTEIQWVATGYMLALATVIPLSGWAADRFGTKRLYMFSIAFFVIGSALAGAAQSATELIAFRVLQGVGGGMVMPVGITILSRAAGPHRVGRLMSVVGVPMLMAPIVGPILGGWLVDDVSWRWIFYVNVPIGVAAIIASARLLPRDITAPQEILDWRGLLLLSPGLAAFVYGLAETASSGGVSSANALAPMIGGLVLIVGFVLNALRTPHALVDVRLFRHRAMSAASLTTFLLALAFFGAMLMIPLYYQVIRGQSALDAGLLLAPQGLGAALMMPLSGKLTDRTGAGRVVLAGLPLIIVGMFGFTQVGVDTPLWRLAACQFVMGLGMGAAMMPAMAAAYQTLQRQHVARATTALNIIQRVGGSIGSALLSVVLAHQLAERLPQAGGADQGLAAAQSMSPAMRERLGPAVAEAFGHTFWWALVLVGVTIVGALLLPRHKPEPPEPELPAPADELREPVGA